MADTQDHLGDYSLRAATQHAALSLLFADALKPLPVDRPLDLRALVEREVVPRLRSAAALPAIAVPALANAHALAMADEASAIVESLLMSDCGSVHDRIGKLRVAGVTLEQVFIELLVPAASSLRDFWLNDYCGLAEVTLAMMSLQGVVRHFAPAFRAEVTGSRVAARETGHRAMIVAPRADLDIGTTMFGLVMLAEFFRRDGWEPWVEADLAGPALAAAIQGQWFDVAEVLVQGDNQLDGAAAGIKTIRRGSLNRSIVVVACGQVFVDRPDFARLVGADLASSDPRTTVIQAQQFVSLGDFSR